MKRFAMPALVIFALIALAVWGVLQKSPKPAAQTLACPDPVAGCAFMHDGMPARLQFSTPPQALKPFVLSIASPRLGRASASFRMVGMDMGFNRYDLRPGTDGNWSTSVTLPVCTVSRVDWVGELDLDGRFYVISFTAR